MFSQGKRKVGFYGDNGYVRLDGISFGPHDSDVSFAFHSQQEHVLLLLASDRHSDVSVIVLTTVVLLRMFSALISVVHLGYII